MLRAVSWRIVFALVLFLALAGCGSTTASTPPTGSPVGSSTAPPLNAAATATAVAQNCFVNPAGPAVPPVYASSATPDAGPTTAPLISGTPVTLSDGLKYVDIKTGTGMAVISGSGVSAEYTGWLASTCEKFDSSYDRAGEPFTFTVGAGQVIAGWDKGVVGMKAGGTRRLYIPAALGYGSQSQGPIPGDSDLIFDITILSVQ
jgi:hypothetical protein